MSSWTKVRRVMGGSDPRHWRVPGFLEMQMRGDYRKRSAFAIGVGIGIASPLVAVMLAIAPPEDIGMAVLLSLLLVLVMAAFMFMYKDAATIIISLEDDGLRRRYKPMFVNLFGWRNRDEFWEYGSIQRCDIVPAQHSNGKYAAVIVTVPDQTFPVIVPQRVDIKQVAAFLATQCPSVKAIAQFPPESQPRPSVGPRGMKISVAMGVGGVVLSMIGSAARLAIYSDGGEMDSAAVAAALEATTEGAAAREYLVPGKSGVSEAKISPDGRWIWTFTSGKKHLVWNDQQDKPVGELEVPSAYKVHARFTSDSRRLIVTTDLEIHVWQLEPLQKLNQFSVQATPDQIAVSADGQKLLVVAMTAVQLYDLATGEAGTKMPITLGAAVDSALSADGTRLIIAQQPRIISVRLADGFEETLITYQSPDRVHSIGRIAPGGRWAAMQSKLGTLLFDLDRGEKSETVPAGPLYANPVINPDGTQIAIGTMQGIGVWDTANKKPLVRYMLNKSTSLDLSDDGQYLLGYSSRSPKFVVWKMPSS
ncbi:MAG: WD40 repeat domain-containing protein [Planctomycetaceae bacterium]|nr:WD40 repeat domain-containing protein [Planctomycetaceae bacterium]